MINVSIYKFTFISQGMQLKRMRLASCPSINRENGEALLNAAKNRQFVKKSRFRHRVCSSADQLRPKTGKTRIATRAAGHPPKRAKAMTENAGREYGVNAGS